jgi:hypothetical protein
MTFRTHGPSLAEALDRALSNPASATRPVVGELADLVGLAETLEASASVVVASPHFRAAARERLLVQMARSARATRQVAPVDRTVMDRVRLWTTRLAAGLAALGFAGAAAASAAASALPGDALYPVKQATEAVALKLATTDSAREGVLLHQADTRLDETARLLEQGRDADATLAAARYDETVTRLNVTGTSLASEAAQSNLRTNEVRLSELLQTAPAPARPGLERALAATERSLGRSRVGSPTAPVAPMATATPERRRADIAEDRATAEVKTPRLDDAGERPAGQSHDSAAVAPRGQGVEHRAAATPVDAGTDPAEVPDSAAQDRAVGSPGGEPHGTAVRESRAGSGANSPPATSQPTQRIAPTRPQERPAPPRTEPTTGRGRN